MRDSVNSGRVNGDRGSVTAELAIALPSAMLVLMLAIGVLSYLNWRIATSAIAVDTARLIARGVDENLSLTQLSERFAGVEQADVRTDGQRVCVFLSRGVTEHLLALVVPTVTATGCAVVAE